MATDTTKTIDSKSILTKLTQGFQTAATKRGGKSGFTLIQRDKRTLAMASVRKDGAIKLEGNRIGKTLRVETAAEIASARKAMEAVAKANASKPTPKPKAASKKEPTAADAAAGSDPVTKARVAKAQAATGVKFVAPSGKRARTATTRALRSSRDGDAQGSERRGPGNRPSRFAL
jgi:hypothetical protein